MAYWDNSYIACEVPGFDPYYQNRKVKADLGDA